MTRLMLLDTASLYFRAFYGVPDTVTAPDGRPVNAVRGLLDFITRLVGDRAPGRLVAALDADWRPDFRVQALPSYKAHRVGAHGGEDAPAELERQVPVIVDVLGALGIPAVGVAGFEADDVIGTYASRDAGPVDVVTGDRDLFQLVDDSRGVQVLYTARGVGRAEVLDEAAVSARYDIPGRSYAEFATLRGDPSDGLPGVRGVGDKTAATLVQRYGDVASVRAAAADDASGLSPTLRKRIRDAAEYLDAAPRVVQVRRDVPVPDLDLAIPRQPADAAALRVLDERWGLSTSLTRVLAALAGSADG